MSEPMDPFEVARAAVDDAYVTEIAAGRAPEGDDTIAMLAAFRHELEVETSEAESPVVVPFRRRRIGRRIGVGVVSVVTALSATGVAAAVSGDRSDVLFPLHRAIFGTEGTSDTSNDTKVPPAHATVEPSETTGVNSTEHPSTQPSGESHEGGTSGDNGSSGGDSSTPGSSDGGSVSGSTDGGSVSGSNDGGSTETPTPTSSDGGGSDGSQTPSPSATPSSPDGNTSTTSADGTTTSTSNNTSTSSDGSTTPTPSPTESTTT